MSRIDSDKVNYGESFVIKANNEPRGISSKMQHALEENNIKALSIIETAKQEAIKIVNEARQQAEQEGLALVEQIKQQAHQEGYDAGYNDGKNQGLSDITNEFVQKVQIFNNFVETTFEIKKRIIKSMHMDMVKMILTIADKVCHKELNLDKDIILTLTQSAIDELKEKEEITIVLNPQIRNEILQVLDLIKEKNTLISNIKITEDSSLSADGTIVEGLDSRIDSRISSQIEELANKLLTQVQSQNEDKLVDESELMIQNIDVDKQKNEVSEILQQEKAVMEISNEEYIQEENTSQIQQEEFKNTEITEKAIITEPQFEKIDENDSFIVKPVKFEAFTEFETPEIKTEPDSNDNI